jgi:uncharacterized protein (TIGR03435 family)
MANEARPIESAARRLAKQLTIFILALSAISSAPAQNTPPPQFEVATIRLNQELRTGGGVQRTPGGLRATNTTFEVLFYFAYDLQPLQLTGLPRWVSEDRYDINARGADKIANDKYAPMVQTLLEERLKLQFHYESRERPVYVLQLVKPGELGPKLHSTSDADCPVSPSGTNFCGVVGDFCQFRGQRVPIRRLAAELAIRLGRSVHDDTGLAGVYDFEVKAEDCEPKKGPADGDSAPLFSAIKTQLGLKLVSRREPDRTMVIDHIERPTVD